jgi:hypothetical protein
VRTRLLLAVAVVALAAGCTTTSAGTPLPSPSASEELPPPDPDEALPSDGAPKVENPLDVTQFEEKPCDVLTPEDAQELNLPATGEQRGDSLGQTCYWRNSETRGFLAVSFFSGDERGLSSIYREAKGSDFPFFEPIADIEGHPAVAYNVDEEEPRVNCVVALGLSDQLAFTVSVDLSEANIGEKDPCKTSADIAGMLMKTMLEAA